MKIETRIFGLCQSNNKDLSELAQASGMSMRQIYSVRERRRPINQKFIVGAMKTFPNRKLHELFYLIPE